MEVITPSWQGWGWPEHAFQGQGHETAHLEVGEFGPGGRSREGGRGGSPDPHTEPEISHTVVSRVIFPLPAAAAK